MKKIVIAIAVALISLSAAAQDSFMSHMFVPVDAGVSLSARDGIGGAFYMRASLEYRPNIYKGLFVLAELDTRTHNYNEEGIQYTNAAVGDAAFTDILIGPGWRFMFSDKFKLALGLQGGVSFLTLKEVSKASNNTEYVLSNRDKTYFAAKGSAMFEYYLNPSFDLFLGLGFPVTSVPVITASMDPFVLFPTLSVGFNMALE